MELVGPRARVLGGTLTSFFYALGEAVLGGVALWLQNWRQLLRVLYTPALLCITYYWYTLFSAKGMINFTFHTVRCVFMRYLYSVYKAKRNKEIMLLGFLPDVGLS